MQLLVHVVDFLLDEEALETTSEVVGTLAVVGAMGEMTSEARVSFQGEEGDQAGVVEKSIIKEEAEGVVEVVQVKPYCHFDLVTENFALSFSSVPLTSR